MENVGHCIQGEYGVNHIRDFGTTLLVDTTSVNPHALEVIEERLFQTR
jgi:hypothetical protein